MADLEGAVSAPVPDDCLLVVDGPLRERRDMDHAVGYVKTHHVAYLPAVVQDVIPALQPGQRTPVLLIGDRFRRWSWYVRLPGDRSHGWAGIVRCEISPDRTVVEAAARRRHLHPRRCPGSRPRRTRTPGRPRTCTPSRASSASCATASATRASSTGRSDRRRRPVGRPYHPDIAVASPPRLLALHALRLRGRAEPADVATYMSVDPEVVRAELHGLEVDGLVAQRSGRFPGYGLTPAGRAEGERLLAAELDDHGLRPHVEAAYEEFLTFNRQLLTVCTMWQMRSDRGATVANDHTDPVHDRAVLDALDALDHHVRPVLAALCDGLERFAGHETRLRYALDRVLAGEHDWFTKPMFPSYHSCWFELHEDLLATLGRERTTEGSP